MGKKTTLSPINKKRLQNQGYLNYSDEKLNEFKHGIRFAYALCALIIVAGLFLNNLLLIKAAATVAFFGIFPPYHPFDYLYNYIIRHLISMPPIPPRNVQGRFACGLAALWLSLSIYLLCNNYIILAYLFIMILLISAFLVSTTDICIPSMIYNLIFKNKQQAKTQKQ